MEINNIQGLEKTNFADFDVLSTTLDKNTKSVTFAIKGGWYLEADKRSELGKGYLKIENYKSIIITAYDAKRDIEERLNEDNFEQFREICEIDVAQDNLIIKGFARTTFNWLEFNITGGIISGKFLDQSSVG